MSDNWTLEEIKEVEELFADLTPEWKIENIKDVAMNRHNVKKSRRPHIKAILDEAFQLLLEESQSRKRWDEIKRGALESQSSTENDQE